LKTIEETAKMFNVTRVTIYNCLKDGLKHSKEKIIGRKPRVIIDPIDVIEYHKSKEKI
jgi:transposase